MALRLIVAAGSTRQAVELVFDAVETLPVGVARDRGRDGTVG